MTVCVVAAWGNSSVIGASDRMITAGDVEFEPQQTKIYPMTTSIAVMIAGDTSLQNEILLDVAADVNVAINKFPGTWINVRDVADSYRRHYHKACMKRSEDAILAPLGLNHDTLISRQKEMSSDVVSQLTTELINFEIPETETIFAGNDSSGFHIYVAHNGKVTCRDTIGFAAIGVGAWHANSHFMFSRHTRFKLFPETLLTTYSAKKRAEVAPGVGTDTDMFVIGPQPGSYLAIGEHVIRELERMYQFAIKQSKRAEERARKKADQYVQKIIEAATPKKQAAIPEDSGGDKASNQGVAITQVAEEGKPEGQG